MNGASSFETLRIVPAGIGAAPRGNATDRRAANRLTLMTQDGRDEAGQRMVGCLAKQRIMRCIFLDGKEGYTQNKKKGFVN